MTMVIFFVTEDIIRIIGKILLTCVNRSIINNVKFPGLTQERFFSWLCCCILGVHKVDGARSALCAVIHIFPIFVVVFFFSA